MGGKTGGQHFWQLPLIYNRHIIVYIVSFLERFLIPSSFSFSTLSFLCSDSMFFAVISSEGVIVLFLQCYICISDTQRVCVSYYFIAPSHSVVVPVLKSRGLYQRFATWGSRCLMGQRKISKAAGYFCYTT